MKKRPPKKYTHPVRTDLTDVGRAVLEAAADKTGSNKSTILRTALKHLVRFPLEKNEQSIVDVLYRQSDPGGLIWLPPRRTKASIYEDGTKRLIQRAEYKIEAPPEIELPVYIDGNHHRGWVIRWYRDGSAASATIYRDLEAARAEGEKYNPRHSRNILGPGRENICYQGVSGIQKNK